MSGYRWDPVFRVVPVNGSETIYWLADRLTDVGGHNKLTLSYDESMSNREDINRSLRPIVHGSRPKVTIECQIFSMADQQFLSEIESALLQPQTYSVFLSLDGGVVERQVVLASQSQPDAIRGKTVVGATFRLSVRCVDLIKGRPSMMTDPAVGAEVVQDGGIEIWSGGQPSNWTGTVGGTTVAQETTIVRDGSSSAKVTRTDGVFYAFAPAVIGSTGPYAKKTHPGKWYRFRGSVYGLSLTIAAMRVQILNGSAGVGVNPDGKTWGNLDLIPAGVIPADSWGDFEAYFRLSSTMRSSDNIYPRLAGYFSTTGGSVFYDAVSIYGPALRPGVATW